MDGGACIRFCPRYPQHIISFSSVDDVLRNSQREFYALDLDREPTQLGGDGGENILLVVPTLTDNTFGVNSARKSAVSSLGGGGGGMSL